MADDEPARSGSDGRAAADAPAPSSDPPSPAAADPVAAEPMVDDAAEESDEEPVPRGRRKSKTPVLKSSDEDDEDEDGDEEEGGADSFLANDDEEEEEEDDGGAAAQPGADASDDSEAARRRERRRKKRRLQALRLDDEDYDLLEENQVPGVRRPAPAQRRRIRKKGEVGGGAGGGGEPSTAVPPAPAPAAPVVARAGGAVVSDDEEEEAAGAAPVAPAPAAALAAAPAPPPAAEVATHAAPDEAPDEAPASAPAADEAEDAPVPAAPADSDIFMSDSSSDEDDEMADFIADEDELDEDALAAMAPEERDAYRRSLKAKRKAARRAGRAAGGAVGAVAQELADLFGEEEELETMLARYARAAAASGAPGGERGEPGPGGSSDEEEDHALRADAFDGDAEAYEAYVAERSEKARARRAARIADAVEPGALERHMLRPEDDAVRAADVPERLQEAAHRPPPDVGDDALDAAAAWVADRVFGDGAPTSLPRDLVLDGIREVDGPPADGRPAYGPDELEGGVTDLSLGRRAIARRRDKDARRAWRKDEGCRASLVASIRAALRGLWVDRLEVPWLATHAKGPAGVGDLLALRDADVPVLTSAREEAERSRSGKPAFAAGTVQAAGRKPRRWDALWAVADAADAYAALARRKAARGRAYARIAADEAAPAPERDAAAEAAGALEGAATVDDVADIDARFELARAAAAAAALAEAELGRLNLGSGGGGGGGGGGGDASAGGAPPAAPAGEEEGGDAPADPAAMEEGGAAAPTVAPRPPARKPPSAAGLRRPVRMSAYATCKRAGLDPLIDKFGLSAAAMADNAVVGYARTPPIPGAHGGVSPDAAAAALAPSLSPPFTNPEAALRGARAVLAAEVAAEPALRSLIRTEFDRHGTVCTAPTPRGELSDRLDPFHPYGRVRRLVDKPLRDFEGTDLFLRIDGAARAGLLSVTVALPPDKHAALVADLAESSNAGAAADGDALAAAWADQRTAVVSEAVSLIIRSVADAASRSALSAARGVAAADYCDALWRVATRAPVEVRRADDDDSSPPIRPRFIAGSHGPGAPATAFVALDERGGLADVLYCAHLSGRVRPPPRPRLGPGGQAMASSYSPLSDGRAAPDARALRSFIMAHAPHGVLVGCSGPDGRALRDVVTGVRDHILEHDPQFLTRHETGDVHVRLVDERLAELWAGSDDAAAELPDQPLSVRRAVAVGRLGLDPLAVLAALAGRGRELAALPLTELQADLGHDAVLAAARRTLVTAVAQVGVDLNAAAACPWRAPPLAYVAGLGPRKAAALLKCVAGLGGRARSRSALRGGPNGLGPSVWRNAASFLRVRRPPTDGIVAPDEYDSDDDDGGGGGRGARHPLDDSRVHPDTYKAARAIAVAALTGADRLPSRRRRRRRDRCGGSESDGEGGGGGGGGGTDDEWDAAVLKAVLGSDRPADVEAVDLAAVAAGLGGARGARDGTPAAAAPMSTDAEPVDAEQEAGEGGDGAPPPPPRPAFQAAPAFEGHRPGYVYGTGRAGTGYYPDLDPGRAAAAAAAAGPAPLPPPALASALPPLVDASFELVAPYGEVRPDAPPTPADEFWLATGQRPDTLRPGLPVDLVIRWAGPHEARGTLPACGGVEAVIPADQITSSGGGGFGGGGAVDPRDYFRPGDVVAARVLDLSPEACEVRVATASAVLNDAGTWEMRYCGDVDVHYAPLTPAERSALAERAAGGGAARRKAALVKRPIAHPHFDNITEEEAVARLAAPEAPVGEALLRPHPAGPHKLRLSLKLHAGAHGPIILHRDVLEAGKVRGGKGAAAAPSAPGHLALGLPLSVGLGAAGLKETYDDLDELLARHAEPLAALASDLAAHRKFVDDNDWGRVKARLSSEFAAGGRRAAAYCICPDYGPTRPGTYFLGFVLPTARATPHREYFNLTPDGIYYRGEVRRGGVERVLAIFKRDPTNRAAAERQAAEAADAARAADEFWRSGGGGGGPAPPPHEEYGGWGAPAQQAPPPPPPHPQQYPYAQQGYGY